MKVVTVSAFHSRMKKYLDCVSQSSDIIVMPRNGNDDDALVLMSLRDHNSILETAHVMSTKANRDNLDQAIANKTG